MPNSPKQSLSLGFPTNTLYALLFITMHGTHPPFLELVTWISDHRSFSLGSNIFHSTLIKNLQTMLFPSCDSHIL